MQLLLKSVRGVQIISLKKNPKHNEKKTPHTHFQTILFINVSIDNINSIQI